MRLLVIISFLCTFSFQAKAQNLSMDQVPFADAIRRLQLMGKVDSGLSLMTWQLMNDEKITGKN